MPSLLSGYGRRFTLALGPRHAPDTLTVEDWQERITDYRERNLGEMLKYALKKQEQARKAGRHRKD